MGYSDWLPRRPPARPQALAALALAGLLAGCDAAHEPAANGDAAGQQQLCGDTPMAAFLGIWEVQGQRLEQNTCPYEESDFLRDELVGAYFLVERAGPDTVFTQECQDASGDSCARQHDVTWTYVGEQLVFENDRLHNLREDTGYECTRRQVDEERSTICDGVLIGLKHAVFSVEGPECAQAVAFLQQRSGKSAPLEGCVLDWITEAHKVSAASP